MEKHHLKSQVLLASLAILILIASGCVPADSQGAPGQSQNATMVVVQYVTQVVATVTPASPTKTPRPATKTPEVVVNTGFNPYNVKPYYPLMGCPVASRLHVGDRAIVASNRNGTLELHMGPNVGEDPSFRTLSNGEVLDIVDGPFCRTQSIVWGVVGADDQIGYVSEGNGEEYWLLPLNEKVAKNRLTKDQKTQLKSIGLTKNCRPR